MRFLNITQPPRKPYRCRKQLSNTCACPPPRIQCWHRALRVLASELCNAHAPTLNFWGKGVRCLIVSVNRLMLSFSSSRAAHPLHFAGPDFFRAPRFALCAWTCLAARQRRVLGRHGDMATEKEHGEGPFGRRWRQMRRRRSSRRFAPADPARRSFAANCVKLVKLV